MLQIFQVLSSFLWICRLSPALFFDITDRLGRVHEINLWNSLSRAASDLEEARVGVGSRECGTEYGWVMADPCCVTTCKVVVNLVLLYQRFDMDG